METQQTTIPPQPPVFILSWREKYAGILVLIIGFFYLLWLVTDFMSTKSDAYAMQEGAIQISTSELFTHIRSILSILLSFTGGWLLLKGKRTGWIIAVALLLLMLTIATGIMIAGYSLSDTPQKIGGGAIVLLLLLGLIFLLLPSAQKKYKVGKRTFLPALILFLVLVGLYFFLQ